MTTSYIIGASLSKPHIDELCSRNPYMYMYYVGTYVSRALLYVLYISARYILKAALANVRAFMCHVVVSKKHSTHAQRIIEL